MDMDEKPILIARSLTLLAATLSVGLTLGTSAQTTSQEDGPPLGSITKGGRSPYQADQPDPTKPPKVYRIPIRGQLGTDINSTAYKAVIDDVRAKKPDLIVLTLNSADVNHRNYIQDDDPDERGQFDRYDIRELVNNLKGELRDIPQVMWVEDAVGYGALLAFPWPDMFMTSNARLFGLILMYMNAQDPDWEKHRKFLAASTGIAGGFFEAGGYDAKVLGEAMIRPEKMLSVSWEGRRLNWRPDENGTYVVDSDPEKVAQFNAKTAEDLMLSKGTADELDELLFMLGYREWDNSLVEGKQDGVRIIDDYIKRWRDTYKRTQESFETYKREFGWAQGSSTEALAHLGKARASLQDILDGMKRYPAVEARWRSRRSGQRLTMLDVEQLLREVKDQIVAAEREKRNSRGGGSGGGGIGGGRGGGMNR